MNAAADPLLFTPDAERRGYIDPGPLRELWFHTGTACNLECPFCLEGSKPGDSRLDRITLDDARPLLDEAAAIGVEQFSFTGGEPFIVKDFVNILRYASALKPCLVLTNGTEPVLNRLRQIETLAAQPYPVALRISIDYTDSARHDAARGSGSFEKAWQGMRELHCRGFKISLARQMDVGEDGYAVTDGRSAEDEMSRSRGEGFGAEVKRRIMIGTYALSAGYYDAYYLKAQKVRTLIRREFDTAFEQCDVIASPTSPNVAFRLNEKLDDPYAMYLNDLYTIPVNIAGNPGISIPCGFSEGLPVGLQLVAPHFQEASLLGVAHAFEGITDWNRQAPPVLG